MQQESQVPIADREQESLGSRECRANQVGTDVPKPCALLHGHSVSPTICSRGNEDTQYSGEVELPYGKTKAMAEKIVLEANGKKVQNPVVAPLESQQGKGGDGWKDPTAPVQMCIQPLPGFDVLTTLS